MNEFKAPGLRPEKKRLEPLAMVSALLALFVMMLPTEADFISVALNHQQYLHAIALFGFCFALVFIPFALSLRRFKREPDKWRGRGYLYVAGVILILNLVIGGSVLIHILAKN